MPKTALLAALLIICPGTSRAAPFARIQLDEMGRGLGIEPAEAPPVPDFGMAVGPWSRAAQSAGLPELPEPGSKIRFVVLGDIEPGRFWFTRAFPPKRDAFERQMTALEREEPAFVLQLGDTVSRGTPENFKELESKLARVSRSPFFPVVGNHDRPRTHGRSDKSLFQSTFGQGDFFFDLGGYRFILLDNSNWELTPAQLAWLERALSTSRRTVVSMHIPPAFLRGRFAKPGKTPKDAPVKVKLKESVGWFSNGAPAFGEMMTRRRVSRVYVGHLHALAYADHGGVRYVLSGGGGSPLYRAPGIPGKKVTHYIVVEAGPDGITERIETLRGETLAFSK